MKRRLWTAVAAVAAVALAALWLASPLLAFRAMGDAARTGDVARLERHVDFPAVRASLKDQLTARLMGSLRSDRVREGPFGALGALLGPSIVDQVVDATVTPAGIAAIVRSGRAPMSGPEPPAMEPPTAPPQGRGSRTRFAYEGLDRFRATTASADAPDRPLVWVLERRGLIGWKLVEIRLPPA